MTAIYEWDEAKRKSNIARHGMDFTVMEAFVWDTAIVNPDDRNSEPRWVAYGFIGVRLYVVVFTERGDNIRIISQGQSARGETLWPKTRTTMM